MSGCASAAEATELEVERRLEDVQFTSNAVADKPIHTFLGGMKRKVLIAMVLLGDPEVVFLDEPSAGLDPYKRRTLWDMIIKAPEGRCTSIAAAKASCTANVLLQLTTLEQVFLETKKENNGEENFADGGVAVAANAETEEMDFGIVQHFMTMTNVWKIKGSVLLKFGTRQRRKQ